MVMNNTLIQVLQQGTEDHIVTLAVTWLSFTYYKNEWTFEIEADPIAHQDTGQPESEVVRSAGRSLLMYTAPTTAHLRRLQALGTLTGLVLRIASLTCSANTLSKDRIFN